jgi:hypothetical protein
VTDVSGGLTDIGLSELGVVALSPGIVVAKAAGMVISPPAFDHWISVPSGPTNLPVCTPSMIDVSALG